MSIYIFYGLRNYYFSGECLYFQKWLLRQSLFPCYEKLKSVKFTKRLEAAAKDFFFLPNLVLIRSISFTCIFTHLEGAFIQGNKYSQIFVVLIYPFGV